MSDAVVFAELTAISQDLVIVRVATIEGNALGICRVPAAAVMPVMAWMQDINGHVVPLIVRQSVTGPIAELIIAGSPLKVKLLGTDGSNSPALGNYPWNCWNQTSIHTHQSLPLIQGIHYLVGFTVIVILLVLISTRRMACRYPSDSHELGRVGHIVHTCLSGLLGLGRDSFARFPLSPFGHGPRAL